MARSKSSKSKKKGKPKSKSAAKPGRQWPAEGPASTPPFRDGEGHGEQAASSARAGVATPEELELFVFHVEDKFGKVAGAVARVLAARGNATLEEIAENARDEAGGKICEEGVKHTLWILTKLNVVRTYLCTRLVVREEGQTAEQGRLPARPRGELSEPVLVEEKHFIYMLDTDYAFVLTSFPTLMLEIKSSDLGKVGEYVLETLIVHGRLSRSEAVDVSKGLCDEAEPQLGFGKDDFGDVFDKLVTRRYVERVPSAQLPPPWELRSVKQSMKRGHKGLAEVVPERKEQWSKATAAYDEMFEEKFELDFGERKEPSVLWRVNAQEFHDRFKEDYSVGWAEEQYGHDDEDDDEEKKKKKKKRKKEKERLSFRDEIWGSTRDVAAFRGLILAYRRRRHAAGGWGIWWDGPCQFSLNEVCQALWQALRREEEEESLALPDRATVEGGLGRLCGHSWGFLRKVAGRYSFGFQGFWSELQLAHAEALVEQKLGQVQTEGKSLGPLPRRIFRLLRVECPTSGPLSSKEIQPLVFASIKGVRAALVQLFFAGFVQQAGREGGGASAKGAKCHWHVDEALVARACRANMAETVRLVYGRRRSELREYQDVLEAVQRITDLSDDPAVKLRAFQEYITIGDNRDRFGRIRELDKYLQDSFNDILVVANVFFDSELSRKPRGADEDQDVDEGEEADQEQSREDHQRSTKIKVKL
ncbi:hypothetical protein HOP50_04g30420 [Chloropicon primus]|uniref:DNA-directed RNA polymerase III subunit RPC3 n=1 Tax=Chloropicon primus TaxID=1764295 RepID=A0A5B8MJ79_9CHLO|nr:hypothetical protein A3770_04p30410 [Chloropicon primus]UPQ99733.1 hypothetical protein HOP50_04g30420 [Chloropicon primus]|eukprot:QDZ20523.1 hypothetical protein A3770_04p30410 [Chloropicon primus]